MKKNNLLIQIQKEGVLEKSQDVFNLIFNIGLRYASAIRGGGDRKTPYFR